MDIKIFVTAETRMNKSEVKAWLDNLGADTYVIPYDSVTDADVAVSLPAKRCYMSFEPGLNPNVTRVRKDWCAYIDNVLASRHGSVLEHTSFTFAIEGCTRVFTAEMNRHRAGVAISEASLRYIRFRDKIPYWLPISIRAASWWSEEERFGESCNMRSLHGSDYESAKTLHGFTDEEFVVERKKAKTRDVFERVFSEVGKAYVELCDIWEEELAPQSKFSAKKKLTSMMRRIIPLGVSVGVVYTINMRALRHILALRATPEAEEEICHVMTRIGSLMIERQPKILSDFEMTHEGFLIPKYPKV